MLVVVYGAGMGIVANTPAEGRCNAMAEAVEVAAATAAVVVVVAAGNRRSWQKNTASMTRAV